MLKVHQSRLQSHQFLLPKPFINANIDSISSSLLAKSPSNISRRTSSNKCFGISSKPPVKAILDIVLKQAVKVKAVVTVKRTIGCMISSLGIEGGLNEIKTLLGKTLLIELVSNDLDPKTGYEKPTIQGFAQKAGKANGDVKYEAEFEVPLDFGEVGAVLIQNEHHKEMYIQDIMLEGFACGPVNVICNSWVHSNKDNKHKRVFFTSKSYLPSETPPALKRLRKQELVLLRGNGQGERKVGDRIYDYDVYNDLGDPDTSPDLSRPVLGGKEFPYPRRCRTHRPRCGSDSSAEKRKSDFYVPRDEVFSEIKQLTFSAKTIYSLFNALVPSLESVMGDPDLGFKHFSSIDALFSEGISIPPLTKEGFWRKMLPHLFKVITDGTGDVLLFQCPRTMEMDKFFWLKDEEFARQTLAGLNPCSIQLVKEWPLKSKLDPEVYGPPESAITKEIIEAEIGGIMSFDKALSKKKLFMLDYHDTLMPFVKKVRALKGTTLYGSRTLFFLTPHGTLRPLAIELTCPPIDGKPQWKQVFTPCCHSTGGWLWRLAKTHVLAHDAGYHQLISHWLRTHCVTEPYIIATNRQLSAMHPIYRLLHPHFRYTMEVNALARESLINADGIIESSFSTGKYSMELSSYAYDKFWRFDHEALPQDLINRGMAVEDLTSPHGLRLTVEDYPFANDGLLLWDIIKEWVTEYVNHYYPEKELVASDKELQNWWTEIRTVGHADKKDEPWWPQLNTPRDLIEIITTIIWVASGHHAAVNFGQYVYGGYFPNRPTIARMKMPTEDPTHDEWQYFLQKPHARLLATFPSKLQATRVMAVLNVLSNHSPDEEYIGETIEPEWADEPVIKASFEKFSGKLKELEGIIDERNSNMELKNRSGAGILPYEFLKPFSKPGVTGHGIPNSISI